MSDFNEDLKNVDTIGIPLRGVHDALVEAMSFFEGKEFDAIVREVLSIVKDPIVAGGIAVSKYTGEKRQTADIDFIAEESSGSYMAELKKHGFKQETIRFPGVMTELFTKGDSKHGVDFLWFENDAFADSMISRARPSDALGIKVRIVSLEDLIVMKTIATRSKDRMDLETLSKLPHDAAYVAKWVKELKG